MAKRTADANCAARGGGGGFGRSNLGTGGQNQAGYSQAAEAYQPNQSKSWQLLPNLSETVRLSGAAGFTKFIFVWGDDEAQHPVFMEFAKLDNKWETLNCPVLL